MFTLDGIRQFHRWTHLCLDRALDHLATLPLSDYTKDVPGFGSPNLRDQVIHCINCEAFWIHMLQGVPFTDEDPAQFPTVADARALESKVTAQTLSYLARLTDQQLNSNTQLQFPEGDTAVRTPGPHPAPHAHARLPPQGPDSSPCAACSAIPHPTPT